MNKLIIYILLIATAFFAACDAKIDTYPIGGAITADQLDVTATPIVVNGKNSNRVVLENHSPVLSQWDYGLGISNKQTDTVLMVVTGQSTILFVGLNPDGSLIQKELSVTIDELSFSVPPEWSYFCGSGEKTWVWDETSPNGVWGNGGYLSDIAPGWWKVPVSDINGQASGEGDGAEMVFSLKGSSLTKKKTDGTTVKGTFTFDMSKTIDNAGGTGLWAIGQLNTKGVNVLCGKFGSGGQVYSYDILILDDGHLNLANAPAGAAAWGEAYYWVFRAK